MGKWAAMLVLLGTGPVFALTSADKPPIFQQVGYEQKVGDPLPLQTPFRDGNGEKVVLGDFFRQRPVLLVFAYFGCTNLCPAVLAGVTSALNAIPLVAGRDFELIVISIDPNDLPALALETRDGYARRYRKGTASAGWHFLTGDEASIAAITAAAGFRYARAPDRRQYAHAAGAIVVTPDGRLSRYFLGVQYPATDLRLALVEAADGAVGNVVDQLLLYCFQYNPETGKYGVVILNVLRLLGGLTVVALAGMVVYLQLNYRYRNHKSESGS